MSLQSFASLSTTRSQITGSCPLDSILQPPTEVTSPNQVRFSPIFKGWFESEQAPTPSKDVNCFLGRDRSAFNRFAEGRFMLFVRPIKDLRDYVELPTKAFPDVLDAAKESGLDLLCIMSVLHVNVLSFPVNPNVFYEIVHPIRSGAKYLFKQSLVLHFPDDQTFYDLNWNQMKKRWHALT